MIMTELQTRHERCPGEATDRSKPLKSRHHRNQRGLSDEGMRADEGTDWFCFSYIVTLTTHRIDLPFALSEVAM